MPCELADLEQAQAKRFDLRGDHLAGLPRRVAGRLPQPVLAEERARKREDLLAATEKLLAPIAARVAAASSPARTRSASPSAR